MWDLLAEEAKSKAAANSAAGAALAARTLNAAKEKLSAQQLENTHKRAQSKCKPRLPSFGQALAPSVHRKMRCLLYGPRWRPKKWRKLRRLLLTAKRRPREAHSQQLSKKFSKSTTSAYSATGTRHMLGLASGGFLRLMWRSSRHSRQKFSHRKEHQRRQNSLQRSPVFEQLQGVSHLTRTTYLLLALQLNQLELACTSFGEAFRLSYPNQTLTVKGYIVEQHVAAFAQKYEICITFGEDGLESLHPWDARCRLIPRTMRVTQRLGTKPPCRTLGSRYGRTCLPLASQTDKQKGCSCGCGCGYCCGPTAFFGSGPRCSRRCSKPIITYCVCRVH